MVTNRKIYKIRFVGENMKEIEKVYETLNKKDLVEALTKKGYRLWQTHDSDELYRSAISQKNGKTLGEITRTGEEKKFVVKAESRTSAGRNLAQFLSNLDLR